MNTSPITRSILLVNVKAARKELEAYAIDPDSSDVVAQYEQSLNEAYGNTITVCGMEMDPVRVLRECDETAYRCGLVDYTDGLDPKDFDDYTDLESALEDAEAELEAFDKGDDK